MNKTDLEYLLTQIQDHCREIESHQHVIRKIVVTLTEKLILDDDDIIPKNKPDTATGHKGPTNGDLQGIALLVKRINDDNNKYGTITTEKFIPIVENPEICNTCGNKTKPTCKIKDGYYCQGCSNDLPPDDVKEGVELKRKFCFKCSGRLNGFFAVDDTAPAWCENCTKKI